MSSRNTRNRKLRMCVGKSLTKRGVDTSSAKRRCVAIRAFKLGRGAPGWGCEKTLPDRCCLTQPLSESFVWRNSSSLVAWLLVAWEDEGGSLYLGRLQLPLCSQNEPEFPEGSGTSRRLRARSPEVNQAQTQPSEPFVSQFRHARGTRLKRASRHGLAWQRKSTAES